MKIKQAFEKNAVPARGCSEPGELLTLRHAIKNYLGRDSALAAVIQAVVDGSLAPVGHASKLRGITGYLLRSEDLRKYRPVSEAKARPEAFFNLGEAAAALGIKSYVVRGLVQKGLLTVAAGYRHGLSKLIPERRTCTVSRRSTWRLRPSLFLSKDVAAQIQIPSRSSLWQEAKRRLKTPIATSGSSARCTDPPMSRGIARERVARAGTNQDRIMPSTVAQL